MTGALINVDGGQYLQRLWRYTVPASVVIRLQFGMTPF